MTKKIDLHTHSTFSQDGKSPLKSMVACAVKQEVAYYGVTEHINFDYNDQLNSMLKEIDIKKYFKCARKLQQKYSKKMTVLVGCEFGYADDEEVGEKYKKIITEDKPDYIINSVHSFKGLDFCILRGIFTKEEMCEKYLDLVEKSINTNYHYDIVGHIGYIIRYVESGSGTEFYNSYKPQIERILKAIIENDKILEINTSSYGLAQKSLPDDNILKLYYELGGRKISFGSDAHNTERIVDKWDDIIKMLKDIGFSYFTVPYKETQKKYEF